MRSKFKWIFTLLVAFTMQFSFAQEKTVTGNVSDETGALTGASVVVKGTTRGVTTDFDGNYSISAKQGDVLEISFTGMKKSTVTVGVANVYDVVLQTGFIGNEIVLTGALGIKRKVNEVTSAYQLVKSEELSQAVNPNAIQALTGKVSGLQINTTSTSVNSTNKIVMRGVRSISGNSEALIVIDGAISSATIFQQLSPDLIDNVNIIKGAQGAALYGSDGVNGVIIVTTKKGTKGDKLAITVSSSVDFTDIAFLPKTQLRYGQGWDGLHANQENGSWGPEFDGTMQPVGLYQPDGSILYSEYSPIKDNIKQFFQKGQIVQNGVVITAGNLKDGYVTFGANRTTNDFIVPGDELKKNNFIFKAGKEFGKWRVEGTVNYTSQSVDEANNGTIQGGLYDDLLNTPSNVPVSQFANSGNEGHWNAYYKNPYWTLKNKRSSSVSDNIQAYLGLGYEINKNINISYLGNIRLDKQSSMAYNNGFVDTYSALWGATSKDEQSSYSKSILARRNYYGDLLINFDYKLTDDISFKANIGNNIQDKFVDIAQVAGTNLVIPGFYNLDNTTNQTLPSGLSNDFSRSRKVGLFANVDLGYKDFLYLNVTGRNDWSSVFATQNNSFFYPSAGVSFILTNAVDALKGNDILNFAKFTANITKVGNDSAVGSYAINQTAALGVGYPFSGSNSYVNNRFAVNEFIKPEFVTTKEIGFNLGFLKDRITLDASYYVADTDDLITAVSSSRPTGFLTVLDNVGALQTKGFEIDLGFTPIKMANNGLTWTNRLSYTHFESIIKSVGTGTNSVELRNSGQVGIYAEVGEAFPTIKGTTYLRDDLGRVIVDAAGLPTIDPNFKNLGSATPDYILGYNTSISYKGLKLSATMDYRTGHKFYSSTKSSLAFTGQLIESAENRSGFIMPNSVYDYNGNGIYEANESNTSVVTGSTIGSYLAYYTGGSAYRGAVENFVLDATAFKLREVALSYELPSRFIKNTGLTSLTVGVNARNFYTWLPKQNKGYNDPETAEATGSLTSGLAFNNSYPNQKTYGFSINVKF